MERTGRKLPAWAIINTALLFGPVFLGMGVFWLWFIPNPTLRLPALGLLLVYYRVVFYVCKRTSGVSSLWAEYQKTNPKWYNYLGATAGAVMFALVGYAAFYVSVPAIATAVAGREVTKEFKVVSSRAVHGRRRRFGCNYLLQLEGGEPAVGDGFCSAVEFDSNLGAGSKAVLRGRETLLGFRITDIGS